MARLRVASLIIGLALALMPVGPLRAQNPVEWRWPGSTPVVPVTAVGPTLPAPPQQERRAEAPERLPLPAPRDVPPGRVFPDLPPDPNEQGEPLPPLEDELWLHGGSYLYEPEGEQTWQFLNDPAPPPPGVLKLRLPEDFQEPRPITLFQDFLGADPIQLWPRLKWPGPTGFQWEPAFTLFGRYDLFGFAFEQGPDHQSGIGHQLLVDFDMRFTGTERFHVQYRPIGLENTGGSFYQFSDPVGYVDNSTAAPDRYWIEFELFSVAQGWLASQFIPRDYHTVVGRFPVVLQNGLLMNDDVVGLVVSKNAIYLGTLSNLNVQVFYMFDDIEAFDVTSDLYGAHVQADWRHAFFEMTVARLEHSRDESRDTSYAAVSGTQFFGPYSLAARAMFKWGDEGGIGNGQLYVLESNWTRAFTGPLASATGVEQGVFYLDLFKATSGWSPISGGNFNRLRSTFAVNPLVAIARGRLDDTSGVALGVQLLGRDQNQSVTPEVAVDAPLGQTVFGFGLRYQIKTSVRSFFDVCGLTSWSEDPDLERHGVFISESIFF